MKKIFKAIIVTDLFLLLMLGLIIFIGCYLGSESKVRAKLEDKHKIIFRAYNSTDILFAPDTITGPTIVKRTIVNLPKVLIVVVDIPADAPNMQGILNLHHSIPLGFMPGVSPDVINKALYNGHKTFFKFTMMRRNHNGPFLDMERPEIDNIDLINKVLAAGDYDGIYMDLSDAKALGRYPELAKKAHDSLSLVVIDETACYKNKMCYVAKDTTQDAAQAIIEQVASMSETDGQWTVVFNYNDNIDKIIPDILANAVNKKPKS